MALNPCVAPLASNHVHCPPYLVQGDTLQDGHGDTFDNYHSAY